MVVTRALAVHDCDRPPVVKVRDSRIVPIGIERSRANFGHAALEMENSE
jgi:hypothetical protein